MVGMGEQAYSWRMLARAMQLIQLPFWERYRIMNMYAYDQSLVPKDSLANTVTKAGAPDRREVRTG